MKKFSIRAMSAVKLALISLALFSHFALDGLHQQEIFELSQSADVLFFATLCLYGLVLMIPFFPALEIGLLLMLLFGLPGVIATYLTTALAMLLAYYIGRRLGLDAQNTHRGTRRLRKRIQQLILFPSLQSITSLSLRLSLCLLLNIPGNALVGGGGGIAINYGYYSNLGAKSFLICVLIATAPLPLIIGLGYEL